MIVDSLDTLMIMDCPEEVSRARDWIKNDLDYTFDYNVNTFETTIRMLGGLLSAYHFSNDDVIWIKRYNWPMHYGAYDSPSGIICLSI